MAEYPKRGSHFAHKLVRLMLRACAAQEIGTDGFALVTAIAHTEDAKRYSGAVTFWNEQLMPILGFTSWSQLDKARDRAIAGGWLHYESGGKRRVGRYWSLIPADLCDFSDSDSSCDHQPSIVETNDKAVTISGQSADNPKGQVGIKCGQSEGTSGEHSTLALIHTPSPAPNPNTPPNPQGGMAAVPGRGSHRKPKKQPYLVEAQSYPPGLDSDAFRQSWQEWTLHRIEKGCAMSQLAADKCLAKCLGWGETRAIAAINHSIANGWQGLFEPDNKINGRAGAFHQPGANFDPVAAKRHDPTYGSMQ